MNPASLSAVEANQISEESRCIHCGTPFLPSPSQKDFCCAGCQYVYGLLHERGFEKYYDLQSGEPTPVGSSVFHERDLSWLTKSAAEAERKGSPAIELGIQGISCIGCVWLLERLFRETPGAISSRVHATAGTIRLTWEAGRCDLPAFAREAQRFGYILGPASEHKSGLTDLGKRMGVCAALAMNAMLFTLPRYLGLEHSDALSGIFDAACAGLATLSLVVGGSFFFSRTLRSLRAGMLHIDLPISIGLIAAYAASIFAWRTGRADFAYFDFVSIFAFLMLTGRWLQQRALESNRTRLLQSDIAPGSFKLLLPNNAPSLVPEEAANEIPAEEIRTGMRYEVRQGSPIPVRSTLLSNKASLSLSWINGEPDAKLAVAGGNVVAGSISLAPEPIQLEAAEDWHASLLRALLDTKPENADRNALLERIISWYLGIVLVIAICGFSAWLIAGAPFFKALTVLIAVLVVSCPCSSGIAIPMAEELAVTRLRRWGVFIREGSLWRRLARVKKILFDKTGTLTLETLALQNPDLLERLSEEERRALLALVAKSLHPVASCIRENLLARHSSLAPLPAEAQEEIGFGLELRNGATWRLGRPEWALADPSGEKARCVLARDGQLVARFEFAEAVRPDAPVRIRQFEREGFEVHLLSGDRPERVEAMTLALGLSEDRAHGGLSPREKAAWVEAHDEQDTLMIGDGANDSLAFDSAFCRGTPAVDRGLLERKADFYFLGQNLAGVSSLFWMRQARLTTIRRIFGFAISYNVVAVALSLSGLMNPLLAAILMPSSSVISIFLAMHGLRKTPGPT